MAGSWEWDYSPDDEFIDEEYAFEAVGMTVVSEEDLYASSVDEFANDEAAQFLQV